MKGRKPFQPGSFFSPVENKGEVIQSVATMLRDLRQVIINFQREERAVRQAKGEDVDMIPSDFDNFFANLRQQLSDLQDEVNWEKRDKIIKDVRIAVAFQVSKNPDNASLADIVKRAEALLKKAEPHIARQRNDEEVQRRMKEFEHISKPLLEKVDPLIVRTSAIILNIIESEKTSLDAELKYLVAMQKKLIDLTANRNLSGMAERKESVAMLAFALQQLDDGEAPWVIALGSSEARMARTKSLAERLASLKTGHLPLTQEERNDRLSGITSLCDYLKRRNYSKNSQFLADQIKENLQKILLIVKAIHDADIQMAKKINGMYERTIGDEETDKENGKFIALAECLPAEKFEKFLAELRSCVEAVMSHIEPEQKGDHKASQVSAGKKWFS